MLGRAPPEQWHFSLSSLVGIQCTGSRKKKILSAPSQTTLGIEGEELPIRHCDPAYHELDTRLLHGASGDQGKSTQGVLP